MRVNLIIYAISLLASTFAISGVNFNPLIKKGHVWEARFLSILIILALAYLVANFIIGFINA